MALQLARIAAVGVLCLALAAPAVTFAHSGRTDASGGHRDNQNASGLGPYHYHHGMGPHLHPGGVCPYSGGASSGESSSGGGGGALGLVALAALAGGGVLLSKRGK